MIRLGAISFVNTIPIYGDYRPGQDTNLIYDVPARLNAKILAAQLDVSPVSSACYLRHKDQLLLLDDLSVSSPGAVESVIFLSKKPMGSELLDFATISIPNDSETSVMLLAHLLQEATGQDLQPWFQVYEAQNYQTALQETGNALVIGDNALILQESALAQEYYCYDLSSLWQERTGLPFVFAVWVARQSWADNHPEALAQINRDLVEARNRFFANPSVFQTGIEQARRRSNLAPQTLERYYCQCLTYRLQSDHQASLALFDAIIESADRGETSVFEQQATR